MQNIKTSAAGHILCWCASQWFARMIPAAHPAVLVCIYSHFTLSNTGAFVFVFRAPQTHTDRNRMSCYYVQQREPRLCPWRRLNATCKQTLLIIQLTVSRSSHTFI